MPTGISQLGVRWRREWVASIFAAVYFLLPRRTADLEDWRVQVVRVHGSTIVRASFSESKTDRHLVDTNLSCSVPTEGNSRRDERQGDNVEPDQAV